ncbi:septum formation family protein [Paeniglutamicibacter sp. NPDC012692]|uniref:septum formation family protein n=1 Tax=Paeniglutamicibacter sp. NPDC012692 TaxID=3364388 RepID=UPI003689CAF6
MIRSIKTIFAVIAGTTMLAGCSLLPAPEAPRNEAGAIEKEARADVFSLKLGDCINEPGKEEISDVKVVPCSEPHQLEVFHEFTLVEDKFPESDEAMEKLILSTCDPVYESFVGRSYEDSKLEYTSMQPTKLSWDEGDRTVHCLIGKGDLSKVTGSLKGSNV